MRTSIAIIILYFLPFHLLAQCNIDSLKNALSKPLVDTAKLKLYNIIAGCDETNNIIIYTQHALELAEKILTKKIGKQEWQAVLRAKASSYDHLYTYHELKNDTSKQHSCHLNRLSIFNELRDTTNIIRTLYDICIFYENRNRPFLALQNCQNGVLLCEEYNHPWKVLFLDLIARIYTKHGEFEEAISNYKKRSYTLDSLGFDKDMAIHFMKIGELYGKMHDITNSVKYFNKSLGVCKAEKLNGNLTYVYQLLGLMYEENDDFDNAILNLKKSLELHQDRSGFTMFSSTIKQDLLLDIGNAYRKKGRIDSALQYHLEALKITQQTKFEFQIAQVWGFIAQDYFKLNEFKQARRYNDRYLAAMSSHKYRTQFTIESNKNAAFMASQIDSSVANYKDAYNNYKQYILLSKQLENEDVKKQVIRYRFQSDYNEQKTKDKVAQEKKNQRQTLIGIGAFIGFCLIAAYFIFRNRIQRLKLKNELQKEKADMLLKEAEYKSRVNDITFRALRAQMNPHFIFNCLNSIKLYTEQNNTEAAAKYLTKFSKLIRNMLDSGRTESITLSQELESLRLYLDMEAMRFKQKLQYSIHVDKDIDEEFIEIPPLLIQPYVENAIWHGLMHKDEGGTIRINVSQSPDHDLLIIAITDDGIGREKAAAIKSKTAVQHKSYGTTVTGERISLINEKYKAGAEAVITDLYDTDNQPTGTLVTIKLPIK